MVKILMKASALLIAIGLLQTCSDSGEDPVVEEIPIINQIITNLNWNLAETSNNKIEAKVIDPQGIENIDSVKVTISNSSGLIVLTDRLYDDGAYYHINDGDVIAGDGVFSNCFDAATDIGTTIGDYQVEIQAFDYTGNQSEISDTTIHLGYSYKVEFIEIQKPDTLKSGTTAEYIYVALMHPQGLQDIGNVSLNLYEHNSMALIRMYEMFNDGDFENTGDLIAADSVFSFKMDSSFAAGLKGSYDLEFTVLDEFGTVTISDKFGLFIENEVGEIIELTMPDHMTIPAVAGQYTRELLTAQITDPQGLTDVDSVYFYSLKPDGNYANSGNPFVLVDNGEPFNIMNPLVETGDITANDGIYSLSLLLYNEPKTLTGMYIFTFYMRDRAGNLAAVKSDSIEVN